MQRRLILFLLMPWISVASYGQMSSWHLPERSAVLLHELKSDSVKPFMESSLLFLPYHPIRLVTHDSTYALGIDTMCYVSSEVNHFRLFHSIKNGLVHFVKFNRKMLFAGLGINSGKKKLSKDVSLLPYRLCSSEGLLLESSDHFSYLSPVFSFHDEEDESVFPGLSLFGRAVDFDLDQGNNKILSRICNPYKTPIRRTIQDGFLFTISFK